MVGKGGLPVDKRLLASAQEAVDPRPSGLQHSILLKMKYVLYVINDPKRIEDESRYEIHNEEKSGSRK
jgi:hypothetical protein